MQIVTSYRQMLRSSSVIGGASVVNMATAIVRMKAVAVLLGAAGVGLIGLYQNLVAMVAAVALIGMNNTGVRQIAAARGSNDPGALAVVRRALFTGVAAMAGVAALGMLVLATGLAGHLFPDARIGAAAGWLALAAALTMIQGGQTALMAGFQHIGDVARAGVIGGVIATVLGITTLYWLGDRATAAFVAIVPAAMVAAGWYFAARVPKDGASRAPWRAITSQWRVMLGLGAALTMSALALNGGVLVVRSLVQRELGLDALGHFQAVWAISLTYIVFIIQAMGTDFYPRLTAAWHDSVDINRMINEQTEVGLLLGGPVLLAVTGGAPLVLYLLYSGEFVPAAAALRWQILGDFCRLAAWPMGLLLLASGSSRKFLLADVGVLGVFVTATWLALPLVGLMATGLAYLAMYAVYLLVAFGLARGISRFGWSRCVGKAFVMLGGALIATNAAAYADPFAGLVAGGGLAALFTVYAWRTVSRRLQPHAKVPSAEADLDAAQ